MPKDRIYKCNGLIATWLMREKNIPLLGRDKDKFCFAKTDLLEEVLKDIPFWLRLGEKL